MTRSMLALLLLLGACASAGADGGAESRCPDGDLGCLLLDADDVAALWPVEGTFVATDTFDSPGSTPWCGAIVPVPAASTHRLVTGRDVAETSSWGVATTASRFEVGGADQLFDAVRSLTQGCVWDDGPISFQFLDRIALSGYGDDTFAALLRTVRDGEAQNLEQVWMRRGEIVVTVAVLPALDSPGLLDQLARQASTLLPGRT